MITVTLFSEKMLLYRAILLVLCIQIVLLFKETRKMVVEQGVWNFKGAALLNPIPFRFVNPFLNLDSSKKEPSLPFQSV